MPFGDAGTRSAGMGTPGLGVDSMDSAAVMARADMRAAGMGGLGMLGIGGLGMLGMSPKTFFFQGNSLRLKARLKSLSADEYQRFTDAQIYVIGQQLKPRN